MATEGVAGAQLTPSTRDRLQIRHPPKPGDMCQHVPVACRAACASRSQPRMLAQPGPMAPLLQRLRRC